MFCDIHLGAISQASILYNEFEKCTFEITATSRRDLNVELCLFAPPKPLL